MQTGHLATKDGILGLHVCHSTSRRSIANEPLPGRCASHLELVYAFATASSAGWAHQQVPLSHCHWCWDATAHTHPLQPLTHRHCCTPCLRQKRLKSLLILAGSSWPDSATKHSNTYQDSIRGIKDLPVKSTMFAYAQAHTDVRRLEFLPYHFLLASVGNLGVLRFQVSSCIGHA